MNGRSHQSNCDRVRYLDRSIKLLSHPKDGYEMLMFSDASDKHWGSFLTQVPTTELEDGVEVEK